MTVLMALACLGSVALEIATGVFEHYYLTVENFRLVKRTWPLFLFIGYTACALFGAISFYESRDAYIQYFEDKIDR